MFINLDYETFTNIFHIYAGTNNLLCSTVINDISCQHYEFKMQSYFIAKSFTLNELNFKAHGKYEWLGSPWCSQRSSERTQFYHTNPYTDSLPSTCNIPLQGYHWCSRNSELSQSSCIGGGLVCYMHCLFTWFHNCFEDFFLEGVRERKKNFFKMCMYLLWCTPCSFTCKKTFPYIIANNFCYFRAGLWPELMSKN